MIIINGKRPRRSRRSRIRRRQQVLSHHLHLPCIFRSSTTIKKMMNRWSEFSAYIAAINNILLSALSSPVTKHSTSWSRRRRTRRRSYYRQTTTAMNININTKNILVTSFWQHNNNNNGNKQEAEAITTIKTRRRKRNKNKDKKRKIIIQHLLLHLCHQWPFQHSSGSSIVALERISFNGVNNNKRNRNKFKFKFL